MLCLQELTAPGSL